MDSQSTRANIIRRRINTINHDRSLGFTLLNIEDTLSNLHYKLDKVAVMMLNKHNNHDNPTDSLNCKTVEVVDVLDNIMRNMERDVDRLKGIISNVRRPAL